MCKYNFYFYNRGAKQIQMEIRNLMYQIRDYSQKKFIFQGLAYMQFT